MALTRITKGVIKPNENYDTHNINSTGIVTAVGADFSGNVSVGGVLTYEDVTSIDSVGIITAQNDVHVGGGVSAVGVGTFGGLKVGTGVTIESNGQLTSNNNIRLSSNSNNHSATARLQLGSDQNFEIYHNASRDNIIDVDRGNLVIKNSGSNLPHGSAIINRTDGQFLVANQAQNKYRIKAYDGGAVELYYDNVERFETTSQGINVIGHSELDNVNIAGVTTFSDNDIDFKNNGITSCRYDSSHGKFLFNHNGGIFWYKNGNLSNPSGASISYSEFANQYKGLVIQAPWQGQNNAKNVTVMGSSNGRFVIQSNLNASETVSVYFEGGVNLSYYQKGNKLQTTPTGVTLNQDLTVNRNALITGISTFTGAIDANGDLDVDGHTNLDNVSVAGITTFSDDVKFTVTSGSGILLDKSGNQLLINSGTHVRFQSGNEVNTDDGKIGTSMFGSGLNIVGSQTGSGLGRQIRLYGDLLTNSIKPTADSSYSIGTSSNRFANIYADTLYGDGSNLTGITQTTINSNTDNFLITGTGTANTLQGESGLQWNGTSLTLNKSTNAYLNPDLNIYNSYNGGWAGGISFSGKYSGTKETQARIRVYGGNNGDDASLVFETGTPTEAFRIDSSQRVIIGSGSYNATHVTNFKLFIKESSNENAAILFQDTDNMRGGICGIARGNNQLITGTTNVDFVVGSVYADTHIIYGTPSNQVGAIGMIIHADTGRVLIGPSAASEQGPAGNLDIVGDTNSNGPELYLRVNNNNTTDNIGALLFGNNVDKSICMIRGATHTANNTGDIQFHTSNAGTMSEKFKINNAGQFTAQSPSAALYGYYTSVNNTYHSVDFAEWTRDSFICLEIFGNVNPNSSGSGYYSDPVHMYVYKGVGWTGSRLGYYVYCVSVAPPARHAFPSGSSYSGNAQISAVWTDGSSNLGNETATSTNYLRLLIPNGNNSNSFPKQFRIFRRR